MDKKMRHFAWQWLADKNRARLRRVLHSGPGAQGSTFHALRRIAYAKLLQMRRRP